ncbi:MAG: D-alanine--D-alanine ligase [Pseudomonadota bacterium]|jgi:D-alanine-D-alanine ligase|nr:D-alanine--D-alanine ligase [Alphaproteobacteria bacterium]
MKKVVVLLGGPGKEREVSLNSGKATLSALEELGFKPITIDLPSNLDELIAQLKTHKPDVVFNCLHGPVGEDGTVQQILNDLNIPYTHSGVKASELAMDKWDSYQLFKQHNIPTPETHRINLAAQTTCPLDFPCIIKPINEGSSVGIQLLTSNEDWDNLKKNWTYGNDCIVQEYLKAREIHVAVLDGVSLGTIEIRPNEKFSIFSYQAKYVPGEACFTCPAPIEKEFEQLAKDTALKAYQALGCRGLSRVDMMFDGQKFSVLELNTQPGFTATSLAPQIAKNQGISFTQLVGKMVESARCD